MNFNMNEQRQQLNNAVAAWKKCRNKSENTPYDAFTAVYRFCLAFDEWNATRNDLANIHAVLISADTRRRINNLAFYDMPARRKTMWLNTFVETVDTLATLVAKQS